MPPPIPANMPLLWASLLVCGLLYAAVCLGVPAYAAFGALVAISAVGHRLMSAYEEAYLRSKGWGAWWTG